MKLVDELVDLLSDESTSLSAALLKTKVLLHKIGHKELVEWVNHELNGYEDKDNLPAYRILPAQVLANMANPAYQVNSHPIPLMHLDSEYRESLQNAPMHQSLAVLEQFLSKAENHLESPIPMEANPLLGRSLGNGYRIQRAWCQISITDVTQILVQVRSRLLDFILELKERVGNVKDDDELVQKKSSLDAQNLFNSAIFGHNTTIVVGNSNVQTIQNKVVEGNIASLKKELERWNVPDEDIVQLETAISKDEGSAEHLQKKFGPSVRTWLQKMFSKAVETSWQVEIGVASGVLATALQNYYGWP
ncbi:MAG: response regulator receiver protein [Nevskia sp.]|nr:response regulator receiver protein [Nevskia sp.]